MPLQRLVPKFGFKNPRRVEYQAVNLSTIQAIADAVNVKEIDSTLIKAYGFAAKTDLIKVLGDGELTSALTVTADGFSKSAISKIEAAGGKAVVSE
jgi:large subunit ribosomal protein L15